MRNIFKLPLVMTIAFGIGISLTSCTKRQVPSEFVYCLDGKDTAKGCLNPKILRIPEAYVVSFQEKSGFNPQFPFVKLAVAYPSMRPWSEIPAKEQSTLQKIEIDIRSVAGLEEPEDFRIKSNDKSYKRMPELLYGLENNAPLSVVLNTLHPVDPNLYVRIRCPIEDGHITDLKYGCIINTDIPFKSLPFPTPYKKLYSFSGTGPMKKLSPLDSRYSTVLVVEYHYNRVLLPHWSDIQTQLTTLIQSFEVIQ